MVIVTAVIFGLLHQCKWQLGLGTVMKLYLWASWTLRWTVTLGILEQRDLSLHLSLGSGDCWVVKVLFSFIFEAGVGGSSVSNKILIATFWLRWSCPGPREPKERLRPLGSGASLEVWGCKLKSLVWSGCAGIPDAPDSWNNPRTLLIACGSWIQAWRRNKEEKNLFSL